MKEVFTGGLQAGKILSSLQHSISKEAKIHIKVTGGIDSASEIIEKIIGIGGRISFFSEKGRSLEDHFSEVVRTNIQDNLN